MISFVELKRKLREILEEYAEKAEFFKETAKETKLKNLGNYQTVPGDNYLRSFTPEDAAAFEEAIKPLKESGILLVAEYLEKIQKVRTEAPTSEAVNYVSMLKLKKDITEKDISNAVDVYGNNYIVYESIAAIAHDNEIYIDDNPLDSIEESIERIYDDVKKMSAKDAERQTKVSIQFALMLFDESIPDEI